MILESTSISDMSSKLSPNSEGSTSPMQSPDQGPVSVPNAGQKRKGSGVKIAVRVPVIAKLYGSA